MRKKLNYVILIFSTLLILLSCKNKNVESKKFEKDLYKEIKKNAIEYINTQKRQNLDFKKITEFEWDYFKYINGNESVPIYKNEIICDLNLSHKTSDLQTYTSRFYFYKSDKLVKELDIHNDFKIHFTFSNSCSNNEQFENNFIITTNSNNINDCTITLHPFCEKRIFKGSQLIEYKDYNFIISSLITKDKSSTYEHKIASKKIIDSVGINQVFNKQINSKNDLITISFDVIEDRIKFLGNFLKVKDNKIIISPNFYQNCYQNSKDYLIFHCEYEFPTSRFKISDFEIKTTSTTL